MALSAARFSPGLLTKMVVDPATTATGRQFLFVKRILNIAPKPSKDIKRAGASDKGNIAGTSRPMAE